MRAPRRAAPLLATPALLLSRVDYGEADIIVHFLTKSLGRIACIARGARRSNKRYSGALEPMHTLTLSVVDSQTSEFVPLRAAELLTPRLGLTRRLDAMEAAGKSLRWLRRATPARKAEPEAFEAALAFLDELNQPRDAQSPEAHLAAFGLHLLATLGWSLELERCVSCGRACPAERNALLSPERGGLVCQACGGGPLVAPPGLREQMRAAGRGERLAVEEADRTAVVRIVDRALAAHMGID